ncbi:NAD(P)H-binding protein [Saccharopolyspora sp. K220]|uniref:SDR family oxidoreductase n=1 Tax=Saccharopolyspora soli TaxID=2926618 RepID=UPI001F59D95E|nr:NAD-dependent epimerase/dehydratase family protein [Saccharopolyspora soli]MCI2421263.1 NAD(P)H-binding protein [Saccharopolyspora soli]
MRILVTGATGMLGQQVVPVLREAGHEVVRMSRRPAPEGVTAWRRADLATGEGLEHAVGDVDAIAHLASSPYRGKYTQQTDVDGTRRLGEAARRAGVEHLLYVSIVGIDAIPWKYFKQKLAAEEHVRGGVPWSIVRATQFYPAIDMVLGIAARLPVMPVPSKVPGQPVDTAVVASRVAEHFANGPTKEIANVCGPEVLTVQELANTWLAARGRRRATFPLHVPGALGKAFRAGALTLPDQPAPGPTWREWLEM